MSLPTMIGMSVTWGDFQPRPGAVYVYVQLADWIEEHIRSGRLKPGDRLPSLRDLADSTSTSVESAGRAMAVLRDRGLVETSRKGTYVKD